MPGKLLYTASTYSHIANFHLPYLRAFREAGWTVHVACGGTAMALPEADRVVDVPFAKRMTAPENLGCARRLGELMKCEAYDLVITHTSLAAFFTRLPLLGRKDRPRVINTVHGYLFDDDTTAPKRQILLAAERLTAPCTDLVLVMNRADEALARRYRLGGEIGFIPGMGVPYGRLDAVSETDGRTYRRELGIPDTAFLMVYAAEFSRRKHQAFLIQALRGLPERAMLLLPGEGAERGACQALAEELGLAERVRFPGQLGDPSLCYRAADCAVSSSRSEGLPFNIMEAMHAGLPVVASDVKGHRDLLGDGCGLLYPYDDRAAFQKAVTLLMDSPGEALRLCLAAAGAAERLRLEAVLPQVLEAYGLIVPAETQEPSGSVRT